MPLPPGHFQNSDEDRYVYEIRVEGIVRYIGKGRNGRMASHLEDAKKVASRPRLNRRNLSPHFRAKLVQAVIAGKIITAAKLASNLTDADAYAIEERLIGRHHKQRPGQLWNTLDERYMKPEYLPDQWDNPVFPLYRLPRPLK